MPSLRPTGLIAVTVLALAVTACSVAAGGSDAPATHSAGTGAEGQPPVGSAAPSVAPSVEPSVQPSPSAGPATLLMKVTNEGGFIGPSATLASLPVVAVYTDGRILTPGAVPAIYPGPLVMPLTVRDVGPAGAEAILAAIRQAGLDTAQPGPAEPGVPDAGNLVFTVVVDGKTTTSSFPAVVDARAGPVEGGEQARVAARSLLDRVADPTFAWGGSAATQGMYDPTGYRIFVVPGAPQAEAQLSRPPVEWPLGTPLASFGKPVVENRGIAGLREGTVTGADAMTVKKVLQQATALTPFTSGGSSYTLHVRPLLPDEVAD